LLFFKHFSGNATTITFKPQTNYTFLSIKTITYNKNNPHTNQQSTVAINSALSALKKQLTVKKK
jgi:hypothetical protein